MKKVKVRIAVAVDPKGHWNSTGWWGGSDGDKMALAVDSVEDGEARYWVEVELDLPTPATVLDAVVIKAS